MSIFRKKKTNKYLFPVNYVDIHSHIIPNIDDGSKTLEESVALLEKMNDLGITNFVFTPHIMEGVWENSSAKIKDHFTLLKKHLATTELKYLSIRYSAEYMLDNNFSKLLSKKDILPIKDNYILVEMSYLNPPLNLYEQLFNIQIAGYKPILAHPERYSFLHNNFNEYTKLKEAGCKFQLNLLSLTNYYGKEVHKVALQLIKNKMIDFVGSDTHHQKHLQALNTIRNDKNYQKIILPLLEKNSFFNI
jgi:protein-tyrosine phosphatase